MDNTELEPTGKRSLPPGLLSQVPELSIPKAAPLPVIVSRQRQQGDAPVDPRGATSLGYATPEATPEAPSLPPPPPRAVTAAAAPRAPAPAAAPAPPPPARPQSVSSRLAPEASMPGVMLAAGNATSKRFAERGMYVERPTRDVADMKPIVGMGVVGLVTILGTGLLMQLVHRTEGWPVARFAIGPSAMGALVLHGGLGLVALVVGVSYFWRGVRHWRGDLSGGPPSAIINAVVAAGAFFAAIELFSAAY
jgi:hypothetical protein